MNLWDVRTLRKIESFRAVPASVGTVSFGAGGRTLLVAGNGPGPWPGHGYLRIWSLGPKPRLLRELHGIPHYTWATFSPGGRIVAATGGPLSNPRGQVPGALGDGLVAEWNAATGKLLARPMLLRGGGEAIDVAFAARGTAVVVNQLSNKAAVLDPARRKVLAHWNGSPTAQYMLGAAISPDGTRVATADLEGYLRVWDAATGKPALPGIRRRRTTCTPSPGAATGRGWSPPAARHGAPLRREQRPADRHADSGAGSRPRHYAQLPPLRNLLAGRADDRGHRHHRPGMALPRHRRRLGNLRLPAGEPAADPRRVVAVPAQPPIPAGLPTLRSQGTDQA